MPTLEIPERDDELFDEATSTFIPIKHKKECFQIEHSLVSLSKWESKWCKPFLSGEQKTSEETMDYIRCMTITQNVNPDIYANLPPDIIQKVEDYINAKMTATWFSDKKDGKRSREVITAEIIYCWMIAQNIPFECQKWHLNRLLTLIRVCNIKNSPPKKQGRKEALSSRNALNQARKAQLNTKG